MKAFSRRGVLGAALGAVALGAVALQTPAGAQQNQTYTAQQAMAASRGRVVLHAGGDVDAEDTAVSIHKDSGIAAEVYGGGPSGKVHLYIYGIDRGEFTQRDLDRGVVGARAITILKGQASLDIPGSDPASVASAPQAING